MSALRGVELVFVIVVVCNALLVAGTLRPFSDANKDAARQLFVAHDDGSFGGLEDTYQAVRSLQVLKSGGYDAVKISKWVSESLSPSATSAAPDVKDIFYGLRTIELLHGHEGATVGAAVAGKLVNAVKEAQSLKDLYFSVGALATIKRHHWIEDAHHAFAPSVVHVLPRIKALEDGNGKWFYDKEQSDSSVEAAGIAFAAAAWLLEITGLEGHKSDVQSMKANVGKVLENIEIYEGTQSVDQFGIGRAVSASSSVLQGIAAFAAVLPEGIRVKEDKVLRLAQFFLSRGTPHSPRAAYFQVDALGILENNRLLIPLAVHLPSSVLSLTSHQLLEVVVSTVLGSPPPEMSVTLLSAFESGKEDSPFLTDEELVAAEGEHNYLFDFLSKNADVGKYDLNLDVKPVSAEFLYRYSPGKLAIEHIVVSGLVSVSSVNLSVLNSDSGTPESERSLDSTKKDETNLVANHLQKLRLSFELTSPLGRPYRPQQTFFKLSHDSGVQHLFVVKSSGKLFDSTLDFLGLLERFHYLSGTYWLELTIGDVTMENSFLWVLGSLDLDLPDAPEGVAKPPAVPVDIMSRYNPKTEIAHIFRQPEKRPRADVSYAFLVLTLLPLVAFFVGLRFVGASMKNFPSAGSYRLAALAFHLGITAILALYTLFWVKLNLFTTLKVLGFLGLFTSVTGHFILSYLADLSSKVKTS